MIPIGIGALGNVTIGRCDVCCRSNRVLSAMSPQHNQCRFRLAAENGCDRARQDRPGSRSRWGAFAAFDVASTTGWHGLQWPACRDSYESGHVVCDFEESTFSTNEPDLFSILDRLIFRLRH